MIAYARWSKWEVIAYKISVLSCGLVFFYVGFTFMNGGYKITSGYLVTVEGRFRDMVYLYVFGVVEFCFECYRRLSDFDQTDQLKYEYQFKDHSEEALKQISDAHYKRLQFEMLYEQLQDGLVSHFKRNSNSDSKRSSNLDPALSHFIY